MKSRQFLNPRSALPAHSAVSLGFCPQSTALRGFHAGPLCILESMLDFEISATELSAAIRRESPSDLVLLDVREPWEYATAKIDGSIPMPMGEIPARVQELDPDAHIVAICHAGVRSMNVAVWLRNQGMEKVQSLRGGIDAWSREVDPKVPRY